MIEFGETPAEKWLREQQRHKDLLAMSNKRQIVGPVLRKPEAPASREGVWEWHNLSIVRRNSAGRVYAALTVPDAVATLNALEDDLAREREAHAATGLRSEER